MTEEIRDRKSGAIEATRINIEREVDLRFPHFQGFVTEVSANLSMTGMFVRSENPQPVGTRFSFRFRIEDWKLIQGTAQVVWHRTRPEGEERPPGMGVRFLELDAQSRRMVRWLVERHLHQGGKPFELATQEAGAPQVPIPVKKPAAPPLAAAKPAAPAPWRRRSTEWRQARRKRRRNRRLAWVALALAGLAAAAVAVWKLDLASPRPRPFAPTFTAPGGGTSAGGSDAAGAAAGEGLSETPTPTAEEGITRSIRDWAEAWSEQRVDDYLSHYADDFEMPPGMNRAQWRAWRRERLLEPRFIRVAITALEISYSGDDRAEATFFQSYRSDRFTDTVRKTLTLEIRDGAWKIVAERGRPVAEAATR